MIEDIPLFAVTYAHSNPDAGQAVCWMLDVRAYGIDAANELHTGEPS